MKTGDRIYYHGDMANSEGTGIIINITSNNFGTNAKVKMDDGRSFTVPLCIFSEKYVGNGLTRFVSLKAFNEYRKNLHDQNVYGDYEDIKTL